MSYEIPLEEIHICSKDRCQTTMQEVKKGVYQFKLNKTYKNEKCALSGTLETACLSISCYEEYIDKISNLDEIVIKDKTYGMTVIYPLSNPYTSTFTSDNGFTRRNIIQNICDTYRYIYKSNDENPSLFGIWGHDIEDLAIEFIHYDANTKMLDISIGS